MWLAAGVQGPQATAWMGHDCRALHFSSTHFLCDKKYRVMKGTVHVETSV